MNTSTINNALPVIAAPANNSKQDAASSSEAGAFNQVLSREIADRNNAGNTSEVAKNAQKDNSNSGDKMKSEAKNEASGTNAKETVKTTDEDNTSAIAEGKKDEVDAEPVTASAEMLAFIASLTQANTAATPAAASDALPGSEAATRIGATDTALDTTLGAATTAAGASEKDAIGKTSDFVAALDKATTATGDSSKAAAPAASAPVKADVELAAVALQTAKAFEPATVTNPQNIAAVTTAALQQLNDIQGAQSSKLAPQVGSPDWSQALGQKVVWMVQGAQQTATLILNPPDLGPMQVTLNVSNNQATANFTAHQPEVRHALEAAMPRLREMLNEAGIQLGQSSVSAGTSSQQNAFSEQRQNARQASQNGNAADPAIHVSHVPVPSAGTGMVDTFA
jgi:flagellar hook-length control protein FliK